MSIAPNITVAMHSLIPAEAGDAFILYERKAHSLPWKLRRYLRSVYPMALATLPFKNPIKKLTGR